MKIPLKKFKLENIMQYGLLVDMVQAHIGNVEVL